MLELDRILAAWRENQAALGVLATVVHVEGSAYRRPGARMLMLSDGARIGTISGGCLEGDVAKKAAWWTSSGRPNVRVYDTTSDDEAVWEFGLGCRGVIHVLLEPLSSPELRAMLGFADHHRRRNAPVVVATLIRAATSSSIPGDRLLFDGEGVRGGALGSTVWRSDLVPAMRCAFQARKSSLLHLSGADFFLEWIGPSPSLAVFGAGHDAIPLAAMAHALGWQVTVADSRPAYANPARFPGSRVVILPRSANISCVDVGPDSAVVLMTHNFPQDRILLPQVLARNPRYVGLLGPRHRGERLLEETGVRASAELHFPAGLDLGGEAPEAIAMSIVSEIQAVLSGRGAGFLKWRPEPIHAAVEEAGGMAALPYEPSVPALCETHV